MAETTSIVRQAPYLEDIQKKILEAALLRGETPMTLPDYEVAGMDPLTTKAIETGEAGIGAFQPYLTGAETAFTEGRDILTGAAPTVTDYFTEAGTTARGTAGRFAPTTDVLQSFMDPYQQTVTRQALQELTRQGDIAEAKARARQVGTGALGQDRGNLQLGDLSRNLLDIGSRRTFEDYSRNYNQAINASQAAFENQQKRQQGVASLMAGLGQATSQEAQRLSSGLGQFGISQANLGSMAQSLGAQDVQLLSQLGGLGQSQSQAELDAARRNLLQPMMEPYTRIGWMSDQFKPAIGSATSTSGFTSDPPPASPWSQALGMGIAGLGINKALENPFGSLISSLGGKKND